MIFGDLYKKIYQETERFFKLSSDIRHKETALEKEKERLNTFSRRKEGEALRKAQETQDSEEKDYYNLVAVWWKEENDVLDEKRKIEKIDKEIKQLEEERKALLEKIEKEENEIRSLGEKIEKLKEELQQLENDSTKALLIREKIEQLQRKWTTLERIFPGFTGLDRYLPTVEKLIECLQREKDSLIAEVQKAQESQKGIEQKINKTKFAEFFKQEKRRYKRRYEKYMKELPQKISEMKKELERIKVKRGDIENLQKVTYDPVSELEALNKFIEKHRGETPLITIP